MKTISWTWLKGCNDQFCMYVCRCYSITKYGGQIYIKKNVLLYLLNWLLTTCLSDLRLLLHNLSGFQALLFAGLHQLIPSIDSRTYWFGFFTISLNILITYLTSRSIVCHPYEPSHTLYIKTLSSYSLLLNLIYNFHRTEDFK